LITADLTVEVPLSLSLGELLLIWDVVSEKLPGSPSFEALGDEERRAIWRLQDSAERLLANNGIAECPREELAKLLQAAKAHVMSLPVDFEDS